MEKRWVVGPEQARQRLDLFLVSAGAGLSRTAIQKAIAAQGVLVNGRRGRAGEQVAAGDEISLVVPEAMPTAVVPENIPLSIVYEDEDLLVVDKPRGLVVHPAAGNRTGTLVNALLAHCHDLSGINGAIRPGIVHRLDKDTTGLLVVAKNDLAHLALSAQLKDRTMSRTYLALIHGTLASASGRLDMPVGRHPVDRKRMAVIPNGRPAVTDYRVLEDLRDYSLLRLQLLTGRTHQIRVHLAAAGHPVVGDRTYGRKVETPGLAGQALHAARLALIHPRRGETMVFQAPLPEDFRAVLAQARASAGRDPEAPIVF